VPLRGVLVFSAAVVVTCSPAVLTV
jgi:hypothetical protein